MNRKEYLKEYNQKPHIKELKKQWNENNPGYMKQYYIDNKEKCNKQMKEWKKNNPEWQKQWLEKNPKYCKEYYKKNKEKILKYQKQWRKNNIEYKECRKKWDRKYSKTERGKDIHNKNSKMYLKTDKGEENNQRGKFKRRARERELINTLTAKEWLDILKKYNYRCAYCGKELLTLFIKPERDHIIPVSKGGDNIKENIAPSCRSCNAKKYDKILERKEVI